jgi:DNA transformation protein
MATKSASPSFAVSREFADYCCELLASAGPCVARRMFGGWGISTDGLTLAIIADLGDGERLYLKASDETRSRFEAVGCKRFVYEAKGKPMAMNYYSAPEDAMESAHAMAPWARLALECALKARIPSVKRSSSAIKTKVNPAPAKARPAAARARRKPGAA